MEIEKHIQNLKDYIRIDKENINYDDSDFSQFCKSHCEDIQAVLDELERKEKIKLNCKKEQIKNAMEDINELVKDIKKNNMYLSDRENLSLQTLNLYINDSTPNCYIREEKVKLKDMLNNVGGEVFITSVSFAIKEIEELLENKE